jgi:fucose permease
VPAHNILYTYIVPFLGQAGMSERIDLVLLVFGVTSLVGIWIVGVLIDHRLRECRCPWAPAMQDLERVSVNGTVVEKLPTRFVGTAIISAIVQLVTFT